MATDTLRKIIHRIMASKPKVFCACINAGVGPGPDMLLTLFASKDFLLCFITWILQKFLMFYTGIDKQKIST